jgi:heat-inducible transcriptional repressor
MALDDLTLRERQVFMAIVHSFVQSAEPVGSRYLSRHYNLDYSPSTVRNIMTDLEEKGLIAQPHSSAGRIPTNIGYREYVDNLMNVSRLSRNEKHSIVTQLAKFTRDMDRIADKASDVLSRITNQLGVALAPRFNQGVIHKIELVSISAHKLLMVLSIQSGLVKTIMLEIEDSVSQDILVTTNQILNERLHGRTIQDVKESIGELLRDIDSRSNLIVRAFMKNFTGLLEPDDIRDVHLSGARNVLSQPEFDTRETVGKMIELIDRKDLLVRVLSEKQAEGLSIVIGEENQEVLMKNCSLITTTYKFEDVVGTIGVIGPMRMQYDKVIALVEFMSETLTFLMNQKNRE